MQKRIELILKTKNLTVSQFADKIGIQRSGMSHILAGRNKPSLDFVLKVLQSFPDLNTNWLLFGKGAMYDKNADLFGNFIDLPKMEQELKSYESSAPPVAPATHLTPATPVSLPSVPSAISGASTSSSLFEPSTQPAAPATPVSSPPAIPVSPPSEPTAKSSAIPASATPLSSVLSSSPTPPVLQPYESSNPKIEATMERNQPAQQNSSINKIIVFFENGRFKEFLPLLFVALFVFK
jgi:transcriptional regulator with XRE-family HTH domain